MLTPILRREYLPIDDGKEGGGFIAWSSKSRENRGGGLVLSFNLQIVKHIWAIQREI